MRNKPRYANWRDANSATLQFGTYRLPVTDPFLCILRATGIFPRVAVVLCARESAVTCRLALSQDPTSGCVAASPAATARIAPPRLSLSLSISLPACAALSALAGRCTRQQQQEKTFALTGTADCAQASAHALAPQHATKREKESDRARRAI